MTETFDWKRKKDQITVMAICIQSSQTGLPKGRTDWDVFYIKKLKLRILTVVHNFSISKTCNSAHTYFAVNNITVSQNTV